MSEDRLLYGFEGEEYSTSFHFGDVATEVVPKPDDRIKIVWAAYIAVMAWER
jgi:hypothetical protein